METQRRQLNRILGFVELLKTNSYPNAESYAVALQDTTLVASVRTIKRDIAYLRDVIGAPIEYDSTERGYALIDERWAFPLQPFCGADVFPNLAIGGGLELALNSAFREAMYAPVSLVNPDAVEIQTLLPLVLATNGLAPLEREIAEDALYAWKARQVLRIEYVSPRRKSSRRDIEVHGLFAQEAIWYVRAWCRLRCAPRTFALHRISESWRREEPFARRDDVLATLSAGNILGFSMVQNVKVRCPAECVDFYAERSWFADEYDRTLPDGAMEMFFPEAPRPILVSWILYNSPELQVIEPDDLRAEIEAKARAVAEMHRTARSGGKSARRLHND